ncbi:MAG TPA: hypothetical protein VF139_02145 [Candidatus Polarisedimenticolaceae bacterium]
MKVRLAVLMAAIAAAAAPAVAGETSVTALTTFTETFDVANDGGWTFGTGYEYVDPASGHPGACLRDDNLATAIPKASTSFGTSSPFTGDWASRGVVSIGIDLATIYAEGSIATMPLSIVLLNDNGTPFDLTDDWGAFFVTDRIVPQPGVIGFAGTDEMLNWVSYDFAIPATSRQWPEGWRWIARGGYVHDRGAWGRLMRDVSHVGFTYGDPSMIWPFRNWDLALDNPRITWTVAP